MGRIFSSKMTRRALSGFAGDSHLKELFLGSSTSFFFRIAGLLAGYLFTFVITRKLGAAAMGGFSISLTLLNLLILPGKLGLDTASIKLSAQYASSGEWAKLKGAHRLAVKISFIAGLALGLALFSGSGFIAGHIFHKAGLAAPLRIISFAVIPASLAAINTEGLRGLKKIGQYSFLQYVPVSLFAALFTAAILVFRRDAEAPVLGYCAGTVLVSAASFYFWGRQQGIRGIKAGRPFSGLPEAGNLLKLSFPMFISNSVLAAMGLIDTLVLALWRTESEVGIYSVALKIAALTGLPLLAINTIAAPKFAELHAKGDKAGLQKVIRHTAKLIFFSSMPVLAVIFAFPSFLLGLFGGEFRAGTYAVLVLAAGQFINAASGSVGYILQMTGRQNTFRNTVLAALAINIVLDLILVPRMGIYGAAFANMLGLIFWNLCSVAYIRSYLNVTTFYFPRLSGHVKKRAA